MRNRQPVGNNGCAKILGEKEGNLTDEVKWLRQKLKQLEHQKTKSKVLICALPDNTLEIFADPSVQVECITLPETNNQDEENEALEWALSHLPPMFHKMIEADSIKLELFSVRPMDQWQWRYRQDRIEEFEYLQAVGAAIDELQLQEPKND